MLPPCEHSSIFYAWAMSWLSSPNRGCPLCRRQVAYVVRVPRQQWDVLVTRFEADHFLAPGRPSPAVTWSPPTPASTRSFCVTKNKSCWKHLHRHAHFTPHRRSQRTHPLSIPRGSLARPHTPLAINPPLNSPLLAFGFGPRQQVGGLVAPYKKGCTPNWGLVKCTSSFLLWTHTVHTYT